MAAHAAKDHGIRSLYEEFEGLYEDIRGMYPIYLRLLQGNEHFEKYTQ